MPIYKTIFYIKTQNKMCKSCSIKKFGISVPFPVGP